MKTESENNWYILHGDQKHGPYTYGNIIHMLQNNQLMDYNYVWAPHLETWTQVYSLAEFGKDRFKLLLSTDSEYKQFFNERKNNRVSTQLNFIGHNNIRFFDGKVNSLSELGALVLINSPLIQVGDKIALQIQPETEEQPAFNLEAVVTRKNFSKERLNSKSGLYYIVKFVDIQPSGKKLIKTWVSSSNQVSA